MLKMLRNVFVREESKELKWVGKTLTTLSTLGRRENLNEGFGKKDLNFSIRRVSKRDGGNEPSVFCLETRVSSWLRVSELKILLEHRLSIPVHLQVLIFGTILPDASFLREFYVQDDSTLHLMIETPSIRRNTRLKSSHSAVNTVLQNSRTQRDVITIKIYLYLHYYSKCLEAWKEEDSCEEEFPTVKSTHIEIPNVPRGRGKREKFEPLFGELAFDVMYHVMPFFTRFERLHTIGLVSKSFCQIVNSDYLWEEFQFTEKEVYRVGAKELALLLQNRPIKTLDLSNVILLTTFQDAFKRPWRNLRRILLNSKVFKKDEVVGLLKKTNPHVDVKFVRSGMEDGDFWFYLKTLAGKIHIINVPSFDITFLELKMIVNEKLGIPVDAQRYIYCGIESRTGDNNRLSDVNIVTGGTMHLVLRLRGG